MLHVQALGLRLLLLKLAAGQFGQREGKITLLQNSRACTKGHFSLSGQVWDARRATWSECHGGRVHPLLYMPRAAVLDSLQGQWLYFVGDSATRGMVLALLRHLDPLLARWVDTARDFNATSSEYATLQARQGQTKRKKQWQSMGGNMLRSDYVFHKVKKTDALRPQWKVAYKKQSQLCSSALCPYYKKMPHHAPSVFQYGNTLWNSQSSNTPMVRISFHNAIGTDDAARVLDVSSPHTDAVARQPSVVYISIGAWAGHSSLYRCQPHDMRQIASKLPHAWLIWGTVVASKHSACDQAVLPRFRSDVRAKRWILDRTEMYVALQHAASRASFDKFVHLGGPHVTYGAATHDYMRLLNKLAPNAKQQMHGGIRFDDTCWMTAQQVIRVFGRTNVPGEWQGWKTPWKLACDFTYG